MVPGNRHLRFLGCGVPGLGNEEVVLIGAFQTSSLTCPYGTVGSQGLVRTGCQKLDSQTACVFYLSTGSLLTAFSFPGEEKHFLKVFPNHRI